MTEPQMTDRLKLAAEALVKRFEYESMALHKTQREWLVREIASALRASAPPDARCREALEDARRLIAQLLTQPVGDPRNAPSMTTLEQTLPYGFVAWAEKHKSACRTPGIGAAGCINTDHEIWRGPDEGNGSYYADSLHVTKEGALGINCGGHVIVRPIRDWHRLAALAIPQPGAEPTHSQISQLDDASNACLELAAKHSFATGHGDTVGDMIREFSAQIAPSPALDPATVEACAKVAAEMRVKHGSPVGDAYTCGVWDQGIRIEQKIRALATNAKTPGNAEATADLLRLVIAARVVAFQDRGPNALRELDQASEAFAAVIPWEDEPADLRSEPVSAYDKTGGA